MKTVCGLCEKCFFVLGLTVLIGKCDTSLSRLDKRRETVPLNLGSAPTKVAPLLGQAGSTPVVVFARVESYWIAIPVRVNLSLGDPELARFDFTRFCLYLLKREDPSAKFAFELCYKQTIIGDRARSCGRNYHYTGPMSSGSVSGWRIFGKAGPGGYRQDENFDFVFTYTCASSWVAMIRNLHCR